MDEDDREAAALAAAVGHAVREARKRQGMTLQGLSTEAGVSQPFLSQLENGRSMPSLLTLHRVANVLGTSAHELLERGTTPQVELIRSGEGRTLPLMEGATMRFLTDGRRQMGPTEVVADPRTTASDYTEHAGEEFTFVIRGTIVMEVGADDHALGTGDGLYYPATIRHRWRNDSDAPATFLMITNPPTF